MNKTQYTKIFISIDWDYCIPIHILNDWGHDENMLYLELIWNMRQILIPKKETLLLRPISEIKSQNSIPIIKSNNIVVAESHSSAYYSFIDQISENDHILLIHYDLHHDIWTPLSENILAENWLFKLIQNTKSKWTIKHIHPKWATKYGYDDNVFNESYYVNILKSTCSNLIKWNSYKSYHPIHNKVDCTFICRSGCWTPPTLDHEFITFVYNYLKNSNLENVKMYATPLEPRKYMPFKRKEN